MRLDEMAATLSHVLRGRQRVLICYPEGELRQKAILAVKEAGSDPVIPQEDMRWKTILRTAFFHHVTAVIGPYREILGLRKVSKATGTPLAIRNVILYREAPEQWVMDGLHRGLDCRIHILDDPKQREDRFLEQYLLSWSGILDFRSCQSEFGLELEIITFPGEKLPQIPSCAKLDLRHWDPETDVPFSLKNC